MKVTHVRVPMTTRIEMCHHNEIKAAMPKLMAAADDWRHFWRMWLDLKFKT